MTRARTLALGMIAALLSACSMGLQREAAPGRTELAAAAPLEPATQQEGTAAKSAPRPLSSADDRSAGQVSSSPVGEATSLEPQRPPPPEIARPAQPQARMVHYNGEVTLRVTRAKETIERASHLAEAAGGYVERMTDTLVTLRIPVAKFREVYAAVLGLGDVVARSLRAQDITEAYAAIELRLDALRASRDRLIALLGKAQSEPEKLSLLQQIRRLTEEVDQLELQLKELAQLAAYSTLTLQLVPRGAANRGPAAEELEAFQWILKLDPFRREVAQTGRRLELQAPSGMVELDQDDSWRAESADGAVIWASRRENRPRGSAEFWLAAIERRLAPEYGSTQQLAYGGFKLLRLVDQSERAYRYLVGVRVVEDELQLVEVYYPGAQQEDRYQNAVRQAVERGAR